MRLYLAQHGEALPKEQDPERPLSGKGRAEVERMARFLGAAGVRAQRVIHSGKARAEQTAALLAQAIAPGVEAEVSGLINPDDPPEAFDWQSDAWDRDTLVVGHLPFMARLASHLLIQDEDRILTGFRPGTVLCLEKEEPGDWRIAWMVRPELLG
ncbi:MAG: phosphohistidine phosphatase SixA [Gammaproteobacteria bacterium]|nr:MAG: phosphohistidine phosphatase SixA [Gammaproteobacteria bacterium]